MNPAALPRGPRLRLVKRTVHRFDRLERVFGPGSVAVEDRSDTRNWIHGAGRPPGEEKRG